MNSMDAFLKEDSLTESCSRNGERNGRDESDSNCNHMAHTVNKIPMVIIRLHERSSCGSNLLIHSPEDPVMGKEEVKKEVDKNKNWVGERRVVGNGRVMKVNRRRGEGLVWQRMSREWHR